MHYTHYIPTAAHDLIAHLLKDQPVVIKVVKKRKSKHGDFRKLASGKIKITVNENDNPFRFLITLLHEIAHHIAFQHFGFQILPHGKEWKNTFSSIVQPFLIPAIFPSPLLACFRQHMLNPTASSDTDLQLALALKPYDPSSHKKAIFELPSAAKFKLDNGRIFQKGNQRRKLFECRELTSGRTYLFQPNAEVEQMED